MIITTTDKYAKIQYGKNIFIHALNTISYIVDESITSITLFRNNEPIGTCPISQTTVNGVQLTTGNIDSLLESLFRSRTSSSVEIADIEGLQDKLNTIPLMVVLTQSEYDALLTKDSNTFYYVY